VAHANKAMTTAERHGGVIVVAAFAMVLVVLSFELSSRSRTRGQVRMRAGPPAWRKGKRSARLSGAGIGHRGRE